ncbi:TetR/AcrR family transcriptional regulator [Actinopolymorpha alba]|uniref:TetR/AcrR family transcriptional regulator n=1 Tax=Actinopolymorpha alba TaxID=533267 RepID=UPI0003680202|nr:TetR/AcrR family transcriptional regulator [Actinopolymorpha alba]
MGEKPGEGSLALIWTQPPPPPRKRALGREEIVRAGIEVADEGGPDALTMNAVAQRLGSYTPMALYRHVVSKDGLVDLMLDAVTAEIAVPDEPGKDWRADLRQLAMDSWAMAKRHPWFAQLVHTRPPLGPHMLRRTEFVLELLARQGVSSNDALTYATLLDRHVIGSILQEAEEHAMRQRYGLTDLREFVATITELRAQVVSDARYPRLAAWMAAPGGLSVDEQFELGLTFLLDGIASRRKERRRRS